MSRPFAGLRVVLVAAFNQRYHHTGLAIAAALERLGCEVTRRDDRPRGLEQAWPRPIEKRVAAVLRRARPDLVLVYRGERIPPEAVLELRSAGQARWALWFPDDPHLLELGLRLAPAYDAYFTHDSYSLDRHRAAGHRAHYLAFGCDVAYFSPRTVPAERRSDIIFVGSRVEQRVRVLEQIADLPVTVWGPGWPRGPLYGEALVQGLAGAKVGLNIHQHFGPSGDPARYGHGANLRLFELAAVGTAQLSDAKADIPRHFEPDREIMLYASLGELRERARVLLDDAPRRSAMAAAARLRVEREHTWEHRLLELLRVTLT
jgi:spore maturation protein CgeB